MCTRGGNSMKFCNKCGVGLEDDAKVCFNCGTPLEQDNSNQQPMLFGGTDISVPDNKENVENKQDAKKKMPIWIPVVVILAVIALGVGVVLLTSGGNGEDKGNDNQQIADNNDTTYENDDADEDKDDDQVQEEDNGKINYYTDPDGPQNMPAKDGNYYFKHDNNTPLGKVDKPLDPSEIYANMKYTPEMLYGDYRLYDEDTMLEDYKGTETAMEVYTSYNGFNSELCSTLPYMIRAGYNNLNTTLSHVAGYYWAELYFYSVDDYLVNFRAQYTVDGNKVTFRIVDNWETNRETNTVTYRMSDIVLTYEYEICGPKITLKNEEGSITLTSWSFTEDYTEKELDKSYDINVDHYVANDAEGFDGIEHINLDSEYQGYCGLEDVDISKYGKYYDKLVAQMTPEGLFTITWYDDDDVAHTRQFVYIYCEEHGIILSDGENTYYYIYILLQFYVFVK